ncbi:hypothetical protein [Rufibacter sp. LB8]|uniref:hypothetical protein n=1 Tax=Rufibacter sp. LB8 TaxID=2777781 RepID=UPI00178C24B6|nr:hypothetical protein [Rufibacter sp. LB8]
MKTRLAFSHCYPLLFSLRLPLLPLLPLSLFCLDFPNPAINRWPMGRLKPCAFLPVSLLQHKPRMACMQLAFPKTVKKRWPRAGVSRRHFKSAFFCSVCR